MTFSISIIHAQNGPYKFSIFCRWAYVLLYIYIVIVYCLKTLTNLPLFGLTCRLIKILDSQLNAFEN